MTVQAVAPGYHAEAVNEFQPDKEDYKLGDQAATNGVRGVRLGTDHRPAEWIRREVEALITPLWGNSNFPGTASST